MNTKPFLIDAVLGNSRMLVTLTRNAELQRLFWPHVDGTQNVERILGGISLDGGPVVWQDSDLWDHAQAYEPDQNVLVTSSRLGSGLEVSYTDAALPERDIFIRHLTVTNRGAAAVAVRYALFQWIRFDENPLYNTALFSAETGALVHYRKDAYLALGADREMAGYVIGYPKQVLQEATDLHFGGGSVLHGDVAGAALWDLGRLAPGDSVSLSLFLVMGRSLHQTGDLLRYARATGAAELLNRTRAYWTDWLGQARPLSVPPATPEAVAALYRRSLLVFKLMSDEQTGAVIAAPEFDPGYTRCGGYAYCWGRDAAYVTAAMDQAGLHEMAARFYRWALTAQEPEGWWAHRHYASGGWGPSWGLLQVDETGSILYGMALHARLYGGVEFARTVRDAVRRAADWLIQGLDPQTGLPVASHDLWEERIGRHTYSAAAVYGGLQAAAQLLQLAGDADAGRYQAAAAGLKAAILRETVREGRFIRGRYLQVDEAGYLAARAAGQTVRQRVGPLGYPIYEIVEDPVPDASLLGLSVPFGVLDPADPVMARTAAYLRKTLWARTGGGLRRYRGDRYRGGNPWVLCTLWLGLYEAERGREEAARQLLDWAVERQTPTGLLPEQVDPRSGEPAWVVPLTWSHAMFVLLALRLYGDVR